MTTNLTALLASLGLATTIFAGAPAAAAKLIDSQTSPLAPKIQPLLPKIEPLLPKFDAISPEVQPLLPKVINPLPLDGVVPDRLKEAIPLAPVRPKPIVEVKPRPKISPVEIAPEAAIEDEPTAGNQEPVVARGEDRGAWAVGHPSKGRGHAWGWRKDDPNHPRNRASSRVDRRDRDEPKLSKRGVRKSKKGKRGPGTKKSKKH